MHRYRLLVSVLLVSASLPGTGVASEPEGGARGVPRARVTPEQLEALKGRIVIIERHDGRYIEALLLRVEPSHVVVQLQDGFTGSIRIQAIARVRLSGPLDDQGPPRPRRPRLPGHAAAHPPGAPRPPSRPAAPPPEAAARRKAAGGQPEASSPEPHPTRATPEPGHAEPSGARPAARPAARRPSGAPREGYRVQWFGLRTIFGGGYRVDHDWPGNYRGWGDAPLMIHMEVILFTLRWPSFYWEILRGGGGEPWAGHWGTAFGYPLQLDDQGRHELRLGVHITLMYGYMPTASGLQITYDYRPFRHFGIHVGVQQYSYPPGAALVFGFST